MMLFVVLFVPPLYFLMRGKIGAWLFNSFLYGLACLFLITIIFFWVAPLFWILSVAHAFWHLRKEMTTAAIQEHAEVLATKMAEKMKQPAAQEAGK